MPRKQDTADAPASEPTYSPTQRLTDWLVSALRMDMVNGYTALSPVRRSDGTYVCTIKDARNHKILKLVVSEE